MIVAVGRLFLVALLIAICLSFLLSWEEARDFLTASATYIGAGAAAVLDAVREGVASFRDAQGT